VVEVLAAQEGVAVGGRTSTTLSPTSRMEMSKVPPPRSNTAIFWLTFLSNP